jgi:hypothetical protein
VEQPQVQPVVEAPISVGPSVAPAQVEAPVQTPVNVASPVAATPEKSGAKTTPATPQTAVRGSGAAGAEEDEDLSDVSLAPDLLARATGKLKTNIPESVRPAVVVTSPVMPDSSWLTPPMERAARANANVAGSATLSGSSSPAMLRPASPASVSRGPASVCRDSPDPSSSSRGTVASPVQQRGSTSSPVAFGASVPASVFTPVGASAPSASSPVFPAFSPLGSLDGGAVPVFTPQGKTSDMASQPAVFGSAFTPSATSGFSGNNASTPLSTFKGTPAEQQQQQQQQQQQPQQQTPKQQTPLQPFVAPAVEKSPAFVVPPESAPSLVFSPLAEQAKSREPEDLPFAERMQMHQSPEQKQVAEDSLMEMSFQSPEKTNMPGSEVTTSFAGGEPELVFGNLGWGGAEGILSPIREETDEYANESTATVTLSIPAPAGLVASAPASAPVAAVAPEVPVLATPTKAAAPDQHVAATASPVQASPLAQSTPASIAKAASPLAAVGILSPMARTPLASNVAAPLVSPLAQTPVVAQQTPVAVPVAAPVVSPLVSTPATATVVSAPQVVVAPVTPLVSPQVSGSGVAATGVLPTPSPLGSVAKVQEAPLSVGTSAASSFSAAGSAAGGASSAAATTGAAEDPTVQVELARIKQRIRYWDVTSPSKAKGAEMRMMTPEKQAKYTEADLAEARANAEKAALAENERLRAEYAELQKALEREKGLNAQFKEIVDEYETTLRIVTEGHTRALQDEKAETAKMAARNAELLASAEENERALSQLATEKEALRGQIEASKQSMILLEDEKTRAVEELQTSINKYQAFKQQAEKKLALANERIQQQVNVNTQQIAAMKAKLAEAVATVDKLTKELGQAKQENVELVGMCDSLIVQLEAQKK